MKSCLTELIFFQTIRNGTYEKDRCHSTDQIRNNYRELLLSVFADLESDHGADSSTALAVL